MSDPMTTLEKLREAVKQWGKCPCCKRLKFNNRKRRLNTKYVNDESNWLTSCGECYEETYQYYADLWADYYAGCY
jgi:hypothetical protein